MFTIQSISVQEARGYGSSQAEANVTVTMDAKVWAKLKKQGQLGHLYGVAISNEVYSLTNRMIPAMNPTVGDTDRASKGIKTISLSYRMGLSNAAVLGLECVFLKNGDAFVKYGARVSVYKHNQAQLRVVKAI